MKTIAELCNFTQYLIVKFVEVGQQILISEARGFDSYHSAWDNVIGLSWPTPEYPDGSNANIAVLHTFSGYIEQGNSGATSWKGIKEGFDFVSFHNPDVLAAIIVIRHW